MDDAPTSAFSYYTKWSYLIAEYASCHYGIQLSNTWNLGKELTVDHCANISKVLLGKFFWNLGKELDAEHCAKILAKHY